MNSAKIEMQVKQISGFEKFNPMQSKALAHGIYNKSVVISAPTASGKTLISELAALNCIMNKNKKVIYTCPLKAIASEHSREFKNKFGKNFIVKTAISTGDLDSSSKHLSRYDLIYCTNEKLDSLIRHQAEWLRDVGLLVVDEVHELDSDRGATLEMVISKLRFIIPDLQVLALSATIPNSREIADWLKAGLVESDYRPVKLKEGILFDKTVHFGNREHLLKGDEELLALIEDTLALKKQALFFLNTRRNAEALGKKAAKTIEKRLLPSEKISLQKISERIESVLEMPTEQCKSLAALVRSGTAFHHAGLLPKQRELIEDSFKEGKIKVIGATPTLAAGVNLPSFRVVIPSLYRFTSMGMQRIPVREYKQMAGRAGRPKYDSAGESIIVAKSEPEFDEIKERYVEGELEAITSKLSFEPILRMHLLALIASHFVFDHDSLESFFKSTFYGLQFGDLDEIMEKLESLLEELIDYGFVEEKKNHYYATAIGHRVSDLYLDPVSARKLLDALDKDLDVFSALFSLINTSEFAPYFSSKKKNEPELWQYLLEAEEKIPIDVAKEQFLDPDLLNKFNSTLLLQEWISEKSDQNLMEEFNVQPGILFSKLRICDWLVYSAIELLKLSGKKENLPVLLEARKRLKYGVKRELLPLVELRGIGRVRARRLFRSNLRTVADLKKVSFQQLSGVLGGKIAADLKRQLGQKVDVKEEKKAKERKPAQSSLSSF